VGGGYKKGLEEASIQIGLAKVLENLIASGMSPVEAKRLLDIQKTD
jgi:hypothetical protein